MMARRGVLAIGIVAAIATRAHADEPTDRTRVIHLAITAAMGVAYLTAEFGLAELSPDACRWCSPTGFDVSARNALRWHDTAAANTIGNLTGYVAAPIVSAGLTILAGDGRDWRRHYDDVVPIVESAIAAGLLQHVTKLVTARQRPAVHFAAPGTVAPTEEDNVSFWSGHTSLGFALAVSSGTVASMRGYRLAPLVWAAGLTLATATGYLRVAADRHWATDVLTGAAVGSIVGGVWPRLVSSYIHRDVEIMPTGSGVALLATF